MQRGTITRRGRYWVVRFNVKVTEGTETKWKSRTEILAPAERFRAKTDQGLRQLADDVLRKADAANAKPTSIDTFESFIENVYLPWVNANKGYPTFKDYTVLFKRLQPHFNGVTLRDFDTAAANRILSSALPGRKFAHTLCKKSKYFLSGAWLHARSLGKVMGHNPVDDAQIPKGKPPGERVAYELEDVFKMLQVAKEPVKTAILTLAFTGLRISELKGLKWSDYDGENLQVQRSVYEGRISDSAKTSMSNAAIPVVPFVTDALNQHRKTARGEFIFSGSTGKPLRFENVARRSFIPALKEAGLEWAGWHGFRYGIASSLHRLGVEPKVMQRILRHAQVSTTMDIYTQVKPDQIKDNLKKLADAYKQVTKFRKQKFGCR